MNSISVGGLVSHFTHFLFFVKCFFLASLLIMMLGFELVVGMTMCKRLMQKTSFVYRFSSKRLEGNVTFVKLSCTNIPIKTPEL